MSFIIYIIDIHRVSLFVCCVLPQQFTAKSHTSAGVPTTARHERHVLIVAEITGCGGVRKDHFLSKELDVRQGLIDLINTSQKTEALMEVQADGS